jgi:imidazolonepropionase-like amidohydrolase
LGSGTDLLGPRQTNRGLEISLRASIQSPMEAIRSATATNAAILGVDDLGTVEAGKLADLVLVDFDPLQQPDLFADDQRVTCVLKDGALVKDLR